MSEEEEGTDLLYEFRHWVSEEEERQEYSRVFFADYYPHLPCDVQDRIRIKVLILFRSVIPVEIYNLPARWALLNPRQIRRYLEHPYWTRLRQSFGQGGESSSAIEEEEEANQPTPESQYSSSSSDTEDFEQVPEEVPNLELHRNNAVLRALNPSGSHQAADRQEEDIQEGCSQPTGVRKAAQEAKQKMLDQQGGAAEIYKSLLSAGYSHEECMETVGLDKSVELPKFWGETSVPTTEFKTPITVSTVKKPIRLRKRKVESVAGQEPELTQQGQDTGPVKEKEQVFQDISFARVLEASSLIKEYMDQQHLNNAVLVNGNSKLKAENEELKKNLENNLLNRAEIEGLQEQIRLLTGKLQAKEEKLDFYQKQLSRRVSTAQMYKEWQEEWSAILNKELDMLFATNARLEADNKVLLNRVTACKEVEKKIKDCTDEELVIDGWYLPAQEVDDMKAELRRQGEQIWMNFGKKMEEVISKPYQIFAKEENSEELLLLQSQLEDLQGKFNFLQEQQSEKEHKKADDSQVDEEFNVKGKRSAVEKFCFDEEPVQQTGEEYESSDLHTLISKIAGDVEKPVKSLEILSDVVITSKNVDDKEQDEKQDDVVKEKDEFLVDVQNIKEQETVAEQQQDVVMEAVGDVQAIQDVVLYEADKKDAD
ncbi:hypothetical protein L7F22_010989 [Adiantum nelumboides]|nr:hypothetical protein [Adiantum nelumboides]